MIDELDTDGDGLVDVRDEYVDSNGDGLFDAVLQSTDSDGDGIMDIQTLNVDSDGDGIADAVVEGQWQDTDGDGVLDTYVESVDSDGDGVYETVSTFGESDGQLVLVEQLYDVNDMTEGESLNYQELEHFDTGADRDDVSGDPWKSMDEWEYQGDTNRCALYSQKFVIEELTGEEIDMEKFADTAEENGWFSEEGGTPMAHMNKMLELYGIDNEMSFNNDVDDIKECLDQGGKVIVSIDADEIWFEENADVFSPTDQANHAVEVIGVDYSDPENPMVIINDSGNPDGQGAAIPLDTFVDAWEDGNCQMIECYP